MICDHGRLEPIHLSTRCKASLEHAAGQPWSIAAAARRRYRVIGLAGAWTAWRCDRSLGGMTRLKGTFEAPLFVMVRACMSCMHVYAWRWIASATSRPLKTKLCRSKTAHSFPISQANCHAQISRDFVMVHARHEPLQGPLHNREMRRNIAFPRSRPHQVLPVPLFPNGPQSEQLKDQQRPKR